MKSYKFVLFLLLLLPIILSAQENNEAVPKYESQKTSFRIAYFGANIINPGLNFRVERIIREKIKTKKRKNGKLKTKHILLNGNLGFFWNPQTHVGLFTNYGFLFRRTSHKFFNTTLGINPLGYYRSFTTETYEVDIVGEVKKKILGGRDYFAPNLIFGIGRKKEKREWFLMYHLFFINNYNLTLMTQLNLEFGYKF